MAQHLPSNIATAAHDPKVASTTALESAIRFYDDEIHPDDLTLIGEELARRVHDDSIMGYDYVAPSYDYAL